MKDRKANQGSAPVHHPLRARPEVGGERRGQQNPRPGYGGCCPPPLPANLGRAHTHKQKRIGWKNYRTRIRSDTRARAATRTWATRRGLCSRRVSLMSASPPSGSAFTHTHHTRLYRRPPIRAPTTHLLPRFHVLAYSHSHATHTPLRCTRAEIACAPARRQVDNGGRVLTRGPGGRGEARLVDLGGRLGRDGATRLAALPLAAPQTGLTSLDLRCTGAGRGGAGRGGVTTECIGVAGVVLALSAQRHRH